MLPPKICIVDFLMLAEHVKKDFGTILPVRFTGSQWSGIRWLIIASWLLCCPIAVVGVCNQSDAPMCVGVRGGWCGQTVRSCDSVHTDPLSCQVRLCNSGSRRYVTPVRTKYLVLSSGIEHPLASSHSRIPASHRFSFLLLWGIERVASGAVMTSTRFVVLIRNFVWTVRERRASLLYMLSAHACLSLFWKVKKYGVPLNRLKCHFSAECLHPIKQNPLSLSHITKHT